MANDKGNPKKPVSRRQFLGHLVAAGAGVAAASLFPTLDLKLRRSAESGSAPAAPAGPEGEGFAFTAQAGNTGRLLRWGKKAEAADSAGIAAAGGAGKKGTPYHVSPKRQWVMVIDLAKCNGCNDCQVACNQFHRVPPGQEWLKIYRLQDSADGTPYWFPRPCMQCDNAPCVKVCPVGATFKREDGLVLIDQDVCIGCRFCLAACPYSARYFNWSESPETPAEKAEPYSIEMNMPHRKGVAEKCLFCPSMTSQGKLPVCVSACTMNAIYFGDRNEDAVTNHAGETVKLSDLLAQGAYRSQEELGTHPRVYYLPPRNRQYPAPEADNP